MFLTGDSKPRYSGELTFLDNTVDRSTGTIAARATIANADLSLLPGQYVRVRLPVSDQPDALLVPRVALGSSQLGKYVYVVGKGNKAEQRLVSLGPVDGDLVAIDKGVTEDDRVISRQSAEDRPRLAGAAALRQAAAKPAGKPKG